MLKLKLRVSKIKDTYITEFSGLEYNQVLKINGEIVREAMKSFQTSTEPSIELLMESSFPAFYVHPETGEKVSTQEYHNHTEKYKLKAHTKYNYTHLETIEYKVCSVQLKLPEFVHSMGAISEDTLNPLVYFKEQDVISKAVEKVLQKHGYTEGKDFASDPMTFRSYTSDNELSFYVYLENRSKIDIKFPIQKYRKHIGDLIEIECQVEELYSKIEKEVTARVSKKDLTVNQIWYILSTLHSIDNKASRLNVIKKDNRDHDDAIATIRKAIRELTYINSEGLDQLKKTIQEENELRKIS